MTNYVLHVKDGVSGHITTFRQDAARIETAISTTLHEARTRFGIRSPEVILAAVLEHARTL